MRTIVAIAPLVALMGTAPAWADPTIYYHAGSWHAFTDKDVQGTAVCGIATSNPNDGRDLSLTFTIGGSDLTVNADKPTWNIPDPTAIDASIQIDQNPPLQAQGVGHGTAVQWTIPAAGIRAFDGQFRNGTTMTVSFPAGNEPPWTLSLNGSTASSATLWRCVQDLTDRARASAPAASTGPTQPFGQTTSAPAAPAAPAAPTQPFAATPAQAPAPDSGAAPANAMPNAGAPPVDTSSAAPTPTAVPPAPPPTKP
jgi:hypothetical protein